MTHTAVLHALLLALLIAAGTALPTSASAAQIDEDPFSKTPFVYSPEVASLRQMDIDKSEKQRQIINDLAIRHMGKKLRQEKENDLLILQTLLDKRIVTAKDRFQLQAMGVALGDLLAKELHLKWVLYKDKAGNTRSIGKGTHTDKVLFPITMISRRVEAGGYVNVKIVYQKALKAAEAL